MNADIIAIDQRFDFRTKQVRSYAVMLVGEKEVRAELHSVDEVRVLLGAGMEDATLGAAATPQPVAVPPVQPETQVNIGEEFDENPPVVWAQLTDDLLPLRMKRALLHVGAPSTMPLKALQRLLDNILEQFTPQQWQELTGGAAPQRSAAPPTPQPKPQPIQQEPVRPVIGQVTWSDGRPIMPSMANPARTVQKDEWGYPIVEDSGVDPGEVVGSGDDTDEDGVGQM